MTFPKVTLRKVFFNIFKILLFIVLIYWVVRDIDVELFLNKLGSSHLGILVLAFALNISRNFIGAFRIKILIESETISTWQLTKDYLGGAFFNNLLPSAIGGDFYRGYKLKKYGLKNKELLSALITERFLGVVSLCILSLSYLIFFKQLWDISIIRMFTVLSFGLLLITLFLFYPKIRHIIVNILNALKLSFLLKLRDLLLAIFDFFSKKRLFLSGLLLSILYQIVGVISILFIGLSIEADISLVYYLTFMPIIWLVTMVPISINGMGIREQMHIILFSKIGISDETAVAISFLFFVQILLQGILGAVIVFIFNKNDFNFMKLKHENKLNKTI